MKVAGTIKELQKTIKEHGLSPVGFVPTMGALHEGHISLVRNAIEKCPLVVVSIYVNPTQFNDRNDLKNYPRTPEEDLALLGKTLRQNDVVFTPGDNEMYPTEEREEYHFGNLDDVMEAKYRPGHFNGVAMVVQRLFEIVKPDYAYFGQKDFQQLAVIKELVRQTGDRVKIIGNPIIRENDGLAMSSRNRLLDSGIRKNAGIIYTTIRKAVEMVSDHEIAEIKYFVKENIEKVNGFSVEYFEIADDRELLTLERKSDRIKGRKHFGCIAVRAGRIRLIDNMEFPL